MIGSRFHRECGLLGLAGVDVPDVMSGRSLLPVGVTAVEGYFGRGDLVSCVDAKGREIARGLVNYPSDECKQLIGKPSQQIPDILGYQDDPELINRENLILMDNGK